jgi:GPH family glycoside/pentoside/hexuronide:cation symporter
MYNTISVAALLATSPIARFTTRVGKKVSLLVALAMSAVAYASLGWSFTNVEGAYLTLNLPWGSGHALTFQWPCLISAFFIGAFTNTMPMVKSSMLADICDYDELQSGHRREAFYNAVFGTCENVAIALSLAFQGAILAASGFDSALTTQADSTLRFWLLAVVISQPVGFLIAIISILFYPLSRQRMREIRAQLDARKQPPAEAAP